MCTWLSIPSKNVHLIVAISVACKRHTGLCRSKTVPLSPLCGPSRDVVWSFMNLLYSAQCCVPPPAWKPSLSWGHAWLGGSGRTPLLYQELYSVSPIWGSSGAVAWRSQSTAPCCFPGMWQLFLGEGVWNHEPGWVVVWCTQTPFRDFSLAHPTHNFGLG